MNQVLIYMLNIYLSKKPSKCACLQVVEIMKSLCEFFPGADTPINYDDLEVDESEHFEEDFGPYSTHDSFETESIVQTHNPQYTNEIMTNPVVYRSTETPLSPRPRSFVEAQVSKLQNLIAAETQPKATVREETDQRPAVKIQHQFKRPETHLEPGRSVNRTPNSLVPSDKTHMASEASTPQDSLQVRSPNVFSESSSPRGISPLANYNIGNMNPRHIDIEQYWNRVSDNSPVRTPSAISTNSMRKEDYNQNYCDRLSSGNSPMTPMKEYNGNSPRLPMDTRYATPLQIEVDPVSKKKYVFNKNILHFGIKVHNTIEYSSREFSVL